MIEVNQKEERLARWASTILFLGVVCWSLNAPLVKYISLDPLLIAGLRALIAGVALLPFLRISKLTFSRWTIAYMISYVGLCTSIVVALKLVAAPIAIGMQYTGMIWLFILAVMAGRKRVSWYSLTPVVLIFMGVIFFMLSGIGEGISTLGLVLVVFEGICFAGVTGFSKKVTGDNPLGLTALANLVTMAFVFGCLSPQFSDLASLGVKEWGLMLFLGIFQIGAGYALYNIGLKYVEPYKASVIAPWEMILGPLWVVIFLHEYPTTFVLIGFAIMLLGMFLEPQLSKLEDEAIAKKCEAAQVAADHAL